MSENSNTSLNHQLSQYVFRSILSTVGASIYVLADSFFVAQKMGVLGVAVMNLSMPLFNVMDGLGFLLGMGGGTLFTIYQPQTFSENIHANGYHGADHWTYLYFTRNFMGSANFTFTWG